MGKKAACEMLVKLNTGCQPVCPFGSLLESFGQNNVTLTHSEETNLHGIFLQCSIPP